MATPRTRMPSFQELTAFEAAGRHGSFTRAADELALTQGAISKQVRQLEATLETVLFERAKGRVMLTAAGRALLPTVVRLLQDYAAAAHSVMASAGSEMTFKLAVLPTFATRWLIPRLPRFLALHPEITLSLVTEPEPFDLVARAVDAAIHFGAPNWAQADCIRLCDEAVVAVAAPDHAERHALAGPADLVRATLLQQASRPGLWQDWFMAMNVVHPFPYRGPLFDQFAMTIEAAKVGLGVALLPFFLVERELADGLVLPIAAPLLRGTGAYHIVIPTERRRDPEIAKFVEWIRAEAAESVASRPDQFKQMIF